MWRAFVWKLVLFTLTAVSAQPMDCDGQRKDEIPKAVLSVPSIIKLDPDISCDESILGAPSEIRIWLFSTVSCEVQGGFVLFEHWYRHYITWGFEPHRMLIAVHKSDSTPEIEEQCARYVTFFRARGIHFAPWTEKFTAAKNVRLYMQMVKAHVRSPFDWVAYADADEFHDFGAKQFRSIAQFVQWIADNNYDAARGEFRDHLDRDGKLEQIREAPSIWEQFPEECNLVGDGLLVMGGTHKTLVTRAYFRTGNGNHDIIPLDEADWYYGPYPSGVKSPRRECYGSQDLRHHTSYYLYNGCYINKADPEPEDVHPMSGHPFLNGRPRIYQNSSVMVHHFKWHQGVIAGTKMRLEHYMGEMYSDPSKPPRSTTFPMYQYLYKKLTSTPSIPLKDFTCWGRSEQSVILMERTNAVPRERLQPPAHNRTLSDTVSNSMDNLSDALSDTLDHLSDALSDTQKF